MIAKIEIYNDNGELVSKCDAVQPYEKWIDYIDYDDDYVLRRYEFRFIYGEFVFKQQKGTNNEKEIL